MSDIFGRIRNLRKTLLASGIGLYLIIGLSLSALCLWLFWEVSEHVIRGGAIFAFDTALANELYREATPLSTTFYLTISWFGSQGIIVLGVIFGAFYIIRRQWFNLTFWLIALAGGGLLNNLIKQVVARPRPYFVDPLVLEQNYSFPSAHAMTSLIMYGILGYLLWSNLRNRYAKIFVVFGTVLFILLIGISRMKLGVHYFSDVVGGFAAGGIWLGICISAINFLRRHPNPSTIDETR